MVKDETINVLYIDDEPHNLAALAATFRRNFNIFTAISAKEAEAILDNIKDIHVLITDQKMPDTLGTELLVDITHISGQNFVLLNEGFEAGNNTEIIIDSKKCLNGQSVNEKPYTGSFAPIPLNNIKAQIQNAKKTNSTN